MCQHHSQQSHNFLIIIFSGYKKIFFFQQQKEKMIISKISVVQTTAWIQWIWDVVQFHVIKIRLIETMSFTLKNSINQAAPDPSEQRYSGRKN